MTIRVDKKKLAIALGKVVLSTAAGNFVDALKDVVDAGDAFTREGPGDATAEDGARLLLQRAAYNAAVRCIQRYARQAPILATQADPREMEAELERLAAKTPLDLTATTFADAERWPALSVVLVAFTSWMRTCEVEEKHRAPMLATFCENFILALAAELRDRSREADYRAMLTEVTRQTPLDAAAQRVLDWRAYRARLVAAIYTPLRSLASDKIPHFSLHDLYVPLRATQGDLPAPEHRWYSDKKLPIFWLDEELNHWIKRADPQDSIRVLSGEPGSGKSSACAMLAAHLADQGRRVLLIPLSRLNYTGDARAELSHFLKEDLGHDALEYAKNETGPPLLLILDGLDELAKAGNEAVVLLNGFIGSLSRAWSNWNRNDLRVQLLLAGRPGAAESTNALSRSKGAHLHVLRYRIDYQRRDWFIDQALAELDQRPHWWKRFGYERGLPAVLERGNIHIASATEQPLLNWLVAQILALEGEKRAATINSIYDLYSRLFNHVLERVNRRSDSLALEAIDGLERDKLEWMLEEVAIAAWHNGGDRTVPIHVVEKRLTEAKLHDELDRLTENRSHALTCLLDSFFCHAHAGKTHRAVEFTHKSFGQFLTARRIKREVAAIHDLLTKDRNANNQLACLRNWLALCGPTAMDADLLDFLRSEMASLASPKKETAQEVVRWGKTLGRLFNTSIQLGPPLPTGHVRAREAERQVRNAELTLLVTLHAIITMTLPKSERSIIRLEPKDRTNSTLAASTLHRLLGSPVESNIARSCLSCLNLAGADLASANLTKADLTCVNLTGADLAGANLTYAKLMGADLTGTNLRDATLRNADLTDANLQDAKLERANLTAAHLMNANLTFADVTDAELPSAKLSDAKLIGANLTGANLRSAILMRTNLAHAELANAELTDADLTGANLQDANLRGTNLTNAYLPDADLRSAKLRVADLRGAKLPNANLTGADLPDANLRDAELKGANLTGANLRGADLTGANLAGADLAGANLRDAKLTDANLRDVNLTDANLKGANLRDAVKI
ncbi:pentapeptide repeat-containing protein [Azospirillum argentinense]|nr:pentapeptide repeat-containing protein [Azospirillum argentinense]